jgi:tetratricopeptide (TPR) repeat protein
VYQAQGENNRALEVLTEALEIAREVGDQQSTGSHLGNIGLAHYVQGEHERAIGHYEQAIDMFRAMGAKRSEGINCGNLGDALFKLERMDEAETAYRTAIEILSETFQVGAGVFHGSLAWLLARKGQNEEAQDQLKKGEALVEPHPEEYAKFLAKKGHVCHLAGDADGARACLNQVQALAVDLSVGDDSEVGKAIRELDAVVGGDTPEASDEERELELTEAERLLELGNIEYVESAYDAAERCFLEAIDIFEKWGDRVGKGRAIGNLASVYRVQGQTDRAVEFYTQAISIAQSLGDKRREGIHVGNLANIHHGRAEIDRAIELFGQAISIAKDVGDRRMEGLHTGNLGNVYLSNDQYESAAQIYAEALLIHRETGNRRSEGIHLGGLGDALVGLGCVREAELAFRKSIELGNETMPLAAGVFGGSLAQLLAKQDQTEEAKSLLETGEPHVSSYPEEYARFLCKKGHVQQCAGDTEGAQASLEAAQALAVEFKANDQSPVAKAIGHLETVLKGGGNTAPQETLQPFEIDDESAIAAAIRSLKTVPIDAAAETSDEERDLALAEAERLMVAGEIERTQSRHEEALQCLQQSKEIFIRHGDRAGEGRSLGHLGRAYEAKGQHQRANELFNQALDIARQVGDKRSECIQSEYLAHISLLQGQSDRAFELRTQALHIAREIGDKKTESNLLGGVGNICRAQGQYDRAIEFFTHALAIARETGDKGTEVVHLDALGGIYQVQGEYDRAIEFRTQALDIARTIGDKRRECHTLGNLGCVYQAQGEYGQAADIFTQAVDLSRAIGDKVSAGNYLGNLGDALSALKRFDEAEAAFRESIPICDETFPVVAGAFRGSLAWLLAQQDHFEEAQTLIVTGESQVESHPEEHAKFLTKKGHVCHLSGDTEGTQAALEAAAAIVLELKVGDESEVAKALRGLETVLGSGPPEASDEDPEVALIEAEQLMELGNLDLEQSHHDEALRRYQEALAIFEKHGDRSGEGRTQGHIGTVYQAQGAHERALAFFTSAVTIAREIGNKSSESMHLGNLAAVYQVQDQANQAIELFSKAIDLSQEIGDKRREGIHLGNLGNVYRAQGENERAVDLFTQAAAIAQEIGDKRSEGIGLGNLGDTLTGLGRFKEAEDALKKAISIGDETYPLAADVFRGSLALLLAQHDQIEEALLLLGQGETSIESQPEEYAKVLGKKAQVQHLAGDVEAARLTLDRVRALADTLNFSDESEVAQSIQNLTMVIGDGTP